MNWKRKYLSFALVTILCISGVLSGCNKEEAKPKTTEKSDATTVSEQIAVVNEDTGVEYPSGTVNYSDEFIKTLDEEIFTITSATDAEEGLKDGTYAGTLMFPANLSYMILNINYGNPQRIKLNYLISDISDKDISDKTHKRIIESYQEFNDRLSYAYINALLEEVEQGQNDVGKIFGNDANILAAAEKFSDGDYDSEYQDPVLPRNTLDYSEHNTDEFRESGVSYAEEVGKLYEQAYRNAYADETEVQKNIPDLAGFLESAGNVENMYARVQAYNASLDTYINTDISGYTGSVTDYENAVGEYLSAVESYVNLVSDYMEIVENYATITDPTAQENLSTIRGSLMNTGSDLINTDKQPNSNIIQTLKPYKKPDNIPSANDITEGLEDFNAKTTKMYSSVDQLVKNLEPSNMLNKAMTTGDGKQTYKQMIDDKKDNFNTKASDTTKEFNRIQSDNIGKLTESYEKNNKYMTETVEALNKKSEKDQETLKKAIGDFLKTAKGNSADTKKRLESFRSMLEKAKVEGRISSAVVEFLIQPIQLEEYNFKY